MSTHNSIFVGYSQDAIRHLPMTIADQLRSVGVDVLIDTSTFYASDPPTEQIKSEIETRSVYLMVLTPASVRCWFHFHQTRLRQELECAQRNGLKIIFICAYGLTPQIAGNLQWVEEEIIAVELEPKGIDLSSLTQVLDLNPKSLDNLSTTMCKRLQAELLVDQGLAEHHEAELRYRKSNSIHCYNRAIKMDENYADAYYQRAQLQWRRRPSEALADLSVASDLDPYQSRYFALKGSIYERSKQHPKAIADYQESIRLAPHIASYHESLGNVYQQIQDFDAAIHSFTVSIRQSIDLRTKATVYAARAKAYRSLQEHECCISDFTHAIQHHPRPHYRWYIARGFEYMDINLPDKAEADWITALETSRCKTDVYAFKARFHEYRGELDQAMSNAEEALLVDMNHKSALGTIMRCLSR
jgi:tetratricopeptide (TPR) repeat protein